MFCEYSKGYGPTFFLPYVVGLYLIDPAAMNDDMEWMSSKMDTKLQKWLEDRGIQNAQWNQTFHEINDEGLPMEDHDATSFWPDRDLCEEFYITNWDAIKDQTTQLLKDEKGEQYEVS